MSKTTNLNPQDRPAGIRPSASYSPELEALRGWAILLVFLFHADGVIVGFDRIGTTVSPAFAFMTAGHTGVTLFFILSAFLLSRPFLQEGQAGHHVDRKTFFQRRVLRIMPLYSVAVLVAIVLSWKNPPALVEGLTALFFLNSFTGTASSLIPYSAVWWSLATEVQFYLMLPILGLCLRSRTGRIFGIGLLLVWAVAYGVATSNPDLVPFHLRLRMNLSLLGRAPAFLCGIGAAWLVLHHGDRIRAAARNSAWFRNGGADLSLLATLFALGIALQRVTSIGFLKTEVHHPSSVLIESVLWTLVVLHVVLAPLFSARLITNRFMAIMGMLSYSLYLIHEPILFFGLTRLVAGGIPLDQDLGLRFIAFATAFALCLALSALTYRLIERPFLVRKARIDR